jgi:co-chaperonin GroES (HSP10)
MRVIDYLYRQHCLRWADDTDTPEEADDLTVGSVVMIAKYCGSEIKVEEHELTILHEADVLLVL